MPVSSTLSYKPLKVDCLSRWMTRAGHGNCSAELAKGKMFHNVTWNVKSQAGIMVPTCTIFSMREVSDAVQWSSLLESSLNHASLLVYVVSGTEKRSCSLVVLLNGSSQCIYLSPVSAFLLPALLELPLIEQFSKHLSLSLPLTSSSWESIFETIFCLSVREYVFVLASVYGFHTSFRNWLSYDNSEGIIQYYCSRCFDVWIEACRADRYDSEDETWTGVAPTKNAATENLNNRHTYGDGQDAFHCILKRDRCL